MNTRVRSRGGARLRGMALALAAAVLAGCGGSEAPEGADALARGGAVAVPDDAALPVEAGTPTLRLLAGQTGGAGNVDGPAAIARFEQPVGLVVDAQGNRYVADRSDHTIRKVAPDGSVSTLAGRSGEAGNADGVGAAARFHAPQGLALDGAGGLFVADTDNHLVRRVVVAASAGTVGSVTTVAGNGAVPFRHPVALAFGAGKLYVADMGNHVVWQRATNGDVTRLAGFVGIAGNAPANNQALPLASAFLTSPNGLALAPAANLLFVIDSGNCVIRRIDLVAQTATVAAGLNDNCGQVDGTVAGSRISTRRAADDFRPLGMALSADASLVVFGQTRSGQGLGVRAVRTISAGGGVGSLLLSPTTPFVDEVGDGKGGDFHTDGSFQTPSVRIAFADISALVSSADGLILQVADTGNAVLRRIDRTQQRVDTTAGQPPAAPAYVDAPVGTDARFEDPLGLAFSDADSLLLADNNTGIRRIAAGGAVSTEPGIPGNGGQLILEPASVDRAVNGLLYFGNRGNSIRGVANGVVTFNLFAPSSSPIADGAPPLGSLGCPRGLAVDSQGRAVVADMCAFAVRRISQTGVVSRIAGNYGAPGAEDGDALDRARFAAPIDVALAPRPDGHDDIYVLDAGNRTVSKIERAGARDVVSVVAVDFDDPRALAVDEGGSVYVAEGTLSVIKRFRPKAGVVVSARDMAVLAGKPGQRGFAPGPLPGLLVMPRRQSIFLGEFLEQVSLKVRNNRLVMTMEKAVVEISPLPN